MNTSKKIAILGIGQAGCRTITEIHSLRQAENFTLFAVDTDEHTLAECTIPQQNKVLSGANWRHGHGCGGNSMAGSRAISSSRTQLENMLSGFDMIFFTGGLGRGSATGGLPILSSIVKKHKIPAIFVVTMPFKMEGLSKQRTAEATLKNELYPLADVVLALPNDLLFSILPGDVSLEEAFRTSNRQIAKCVISLAMIFSGGNLLPANYSDFAELMQKKKSSVSIGIGLCSAKDAPEAKNSLLIERMLQSPLLGGVKKVRESHAIIASLLGGSSLNSADCLHIFDKIKDITPENCQQIHSVSTDDALGDSAILSVITVKFDDSNDFESVLGVPEEGKITRHKNNDKLSGEQLGLPLDALSRGIMEHTAATIINNEDMDIPTFQRLQRKIDSGK